MSEEQQAEVIAETVSEQFNDHFSDAGNMVHEPVPEVHAPELVEEYRALIIDNNKSISYKLMRARRVIILSN